LVLYNKTYEKGKLYETEFTKQEMDSIQVELRRITAIKCDTLIRHVSDGLRYAITLDNPDGMGVGDYFSENGEYMGTDNIDDKKIYVVQNTQAADAGLAPGYGTFSAPNGFYKSDGSVDVKVGTANSVDLADMGGIENVDAREKAAGGILNHYYEAAGYNLSELKDGGIVDRGAKYGLAETLLGGVTRDSPGLGDGEKRIEVSFSMSGSIPKDAEHRAYTHQVNHSSWKTVSDKWKEHIRVNGVFTPEQRKNIFKK